MKPVEKILTDTESFIGAWYMNNISVCDKLIDCFENYKYSGFDGGKQQGSLSSKSGYGNQVDKERKDSIDLCIKAGHPLFLEYFHEVRPILDLYLERYQYAIGPLTSPVINIQKYNKGGAAYHAWHFELGGFDLEIIKRHLVFMTYLNDVDEGGETLFLYQNLKIKPEKGLTLIWPTPWTHTHKGVPSQNFDKYIATGWYSRLNYNPE